MSDKIVRVLRLPSMPQITAYAINIFYAEILDRIVVELRSGASIAIPRAAITEFKSLEPDILRTITIIDKGESIGCQGLSLPVRIRDLIRVVAEIDASQR